MDDSHDNRLEEIANVTKFIEESTIAIPSISLLAEDGEVMLRIKEQGDNVNKVGSS